MLYASSFIRITIVSCRVKIGLNFHKDSDLSVCPDRLIKIGFHYLIAGSKQAYWIYTV